MNYQNFVKSALKKFPNEIFCFSTYRFFGLESLDWNMAVDFVFDCGSLSRIHIGEIFHEVYQGYFCFLDCSAVYSHCFWKIGGGVQGSPFAGIYTFIYIFGFNFFFIIITYILFFRVLKHIVMPYPLPGYSMKTSIRIQSINPM